MNTLTICLTLLVALVWATTLFNPAARDFVARHFVGIAMTLGVALDVAQTKIEATPHFGRRETVELLIAVLASICMTIGAYKAIPGQGRAFAKGPPAPPPPPNP